MAAFLKIRKVTDIKTGILFLCFLWYAFNADGHILDELSVKTRITIESKIIYMKIELAPGLLISEPFLKILDPGRTTFIKESGKKAFIEHVTADMKVRLNGGKVQPICDSIKVPPISELITGTGTIYIDYHVPVGGNGRSDHELYYENILENKIALYSLHIAARAEKGVKIISEKRDEITQESVSLTFSTFPQNEVRVVVPTIDGLKKRPSLKSQADETLGAVSNLFGVQHLVSVLKEGCFSTSVVLVLLILAAIAGFLHAFTPGHGKALVGAYLVANRGQFFQAIALGLIVSMTHTLAIYFFGGLSLTATYFFLPSKIVPIMSVFSGVLIIGIGIYGFIRRILGLNREHAHLLPNLSVFKEKNINILVDGNAADSTEYLILAAEEEIVQASLKAAGVDDITICSPGCETHHMSFFKKTSDQQSFRLLKKAINTGVIDAVVTETDRKLNRIIPLFRKRSGGVYKAPQKIKEAEILLMDTLAKYPQKRSVRIPDSEMSWRNLIYLGFAGGIVPCPDALAILLISISMGQILLGLSIVFFFSIGLSLALILIGILIVSTGKLAMNSRVLFSATRYIPYFTSIFLVGLGGYIITNASSVLPVL